MSGYADRVTKEERMSVKGVMHSAGGLSQAELSYSGALMKVA